MFEKSSRVCEVCNSYLHKYSGDGNFYCPSCDVAKLRRVVIFWRDRRGTCSDIFLEAKSMLRRLMAIGGFV